MSDAVHGRSVIFRNLLRKILHFRVKVKRENSRIEISLALGIFGLNFEIGTSEGIHAWVLARHVSRFVVFS